MLDKLKLNAIQIAKQAMLFCSTIFSLVAIVTSFVTWEELGIGKQRRIGILVVSIVFSVVGAVIYILAIKKKNVVWRNGGAKLQVRYGNVVSLGKQKHNKKERIIVIPVNTCFDTLVDVDIASVEKPLVSPRSVHGQWVKSIIEDGVLLEELDQKIEQSIQVHNLQAVKSFNCQEKTRGKLDVYPMGSIIPISLKEHTTFFLFALSEFDENNKAQCSEDDFITGLVHLIDSYNAKGQGFELFLPLVGTGMSRVNYQHQEALQKIKATFELNRSKIKGTVNIVIYSKDSDKVSIYD